MMILLCSAAFFASGFAALLYQVIWQRMLVIFSGADLYSVTIIVSAFMGGIGAGNLAGGHVADRTSARTGLLLFATAELAIALFGFFSVALYYGFLYVRLGETQIPSALMAGILFLSLLWPTFFMGASLPLLARALSQRIERAAPIIGVLYGMNTLGAAAGALLSTWVLIPRFGLEGSLAFGVALNVTCAILLLPAAVAAGRSSDAESRRGSADTGAGHGGHDEPSAEVAVPSLGVWAVTFAASGFLALSLEIVWFRVIGVAMKSTSFTFGTLLFVYLTGIGAGSLIGSVAAPRLRRPALVFLGLQAAVAASAAVLLALFVRWVDDTVLWSYLGAYEPLNVRESINLLVAFAGGSAPSGDASTLLGKFLVFYLAVPALLVLPPTLLMGCSFPVLQRVVQTNITTIGRRFGVLLLANVLGSMVGTVLTGWLLLDWLGTAWTMVLLVGVGGVFALAGVWTAGASPGSRRLSSSRRPGLLALAGTVAGLVALMPGPGLFWAHLHGATEADVVFEEDGSGLSVITVDRQQARVFVNGIGQSLIPYGDVHTALGALPAFIHPSPRTAAVIGLGSGDTVHAVAGRRELEDITCVEIVRAQVRTLEAVRARVPYPGLFAMLSDPRIHQVSGDGRIHLTRGGRLYDIIEADALRPSSAYSGNLYSDAYFELVLDHLTPNGLAATWAPSRRVFNTFIRTFPYVVGAAGSSILIGSRQPFTIDRAAVNARLADPWTQDHFAGAGIDIERLLSGSLDSLAIFGPDFPRASLTDFNTDLFPKDEFDLSPSAK